MNFRGTDYHSERKEEKFKNLEEPSQPDRDKKARTSKVQIEKSPNQTLKGGTSDGPRL